MNLSSFKKISLECCLSILYLKSALKDSISNKEKSKRIFLFEPLDKSKKPFTHVLESELKCIDYQIIQKEDLSGSYRKLFKFIFEPIELYFSNIDEGITDEKRILRVKNYRQRRYFYRNSKR